MVEKKSRFLVPLLVGVLLLVIALPTQETQHGPGDCRFGRDIRSAGIRGSGQAGTEYPEQKTAGRAVTRLRSGAGRSDPYGKIPTVGHLWKRIRRVRKRKRMKRTARENALSCRVLRSAVYEKDASGKEIPFAEPDESSPEISRRLLALAEGGGDGGIQAEMTEAAMALFGPGRA